MNTPDSECGARGDLDLVSAGIFADLGVVVSGSVKTLPTWPKEHYGKSRLPRRVGVAWESRTPRRGSPRGPSSAASRRYLR